MHCRRREIDCGRRAREENDNRRSCPGIGASGGATQDTAKAVMVSGRIAARGARTGTVDRAINIAVGNEGGGWRRCGEQALQQKRIDRKRADRATLCNRAPSP